MRKFAWVALTMFVMAGCGKTEQAPAAKTPVPEAAAVPEVNIGMQLVLLGSSLDVLTAQANLLTLGSQDYSPVQFENDIQKAKVDAETRFTAMFAASGKSASLDEAVRSTAVAYMAFLDDVRPRNGEPVSLWQKRSSDSRSAYDRAAAAVDVALMAPKQ